MGKPVGKRDRSGNKYRFPMNKAQSPKSIVNNKQYHRDEVKHLLGKLVDVKAIVRLDSKEDKDDYCLLHQLEIQHQDEIIYLEYAWIKKRKFIQANTLSGSKVLFSARVRVYNGKDKIKYGLIPIKIKEISL